MVFFFFVKQTSAYEMLISDGSSAVCSSDLVQLVDGAAVGPLRGVGHLDRVAHARGGQPVVLVADAVHGRVHTRIEDPVEGRGQAQVAGVAALRDRKCRGEGERVLVGVDIVCRRYIIKKKMKLQQ